LRLRPTAASRARGQRPPVACGWRIGSAEALEAWDHPHRRGFPLATQVAPLRGDLRHIFGGVGSAPAGLVAVGVIVPEDRDRYAHRGREEAAHECSGPLITSDDP